MSIDELASCLAATGRRLHARGWAMGTAGNWSAVSSREPLRLLMSPSGADKGRLEPGEMLGLDDSGRVISGTGRPSAEAPVHLAVVHERGAGAVLHTHSVWNTLLSEAGGDTGGLRIEGFEMLKGLSGVTTHEHVEWVPVLENTQDYDRMGAGVGAALRDYPQGHGLLLRGHGLYTWGRDLEEAERHVEILEFLFEVVGRLYLATGRLDGRASSRRPEAAEPEGGQADGDRQDSGARPRH